MQYKLINARRRSQLAGWEKPGRRTAITLTSRPAFRSRRYDALSHQCHDFGSTVERISVNFPFPEAHDCPSAFSQLTINEPITRPISLDFRKPVRLVGLVFSASTAPPSIPVPKFAVAEDRDSPADDDKVRFSEDGVLFAISDAGTPKRLP